MNSNQIKLDFEKGRELRDAGIEQALSHADAVHENWRDRAYEFFLKFLTTHKEPFLGEDVRVLADGIIPEPPDRRAWGGVMIRAKKAGLIKSLGFKPAKNPKAHACPSNVWLKI